MSSADRPDQGLVADQQNAAYSNDQLKAQPGAGSVPPPASAQPPAAPTTTEAAAGTTTAAAAPTPPATGTAPASPSVEQSTLPPPNSATQTASTAAPATVPYGTPMAAAPATVPYGTPMPAASSPAPAADAPHYASPYYPLPVAGAPAAYAPAPGQVAPVQTASAQLPPSAAPIVIQDQAKLASILGAGTPLLPGQAGGPAAAVQQPPIAVIFFRAGSAGLSSRDYRVLHDVMLLQQQQGGQLRVIGHASERTETTDYATHQAINENLSLKRASAVGGALLQMGVPGSAVAISAVGGQGPIFYEFMPTGEAGNRRVEIFLVR